MHEETRITGEKFFVAAVVNCFTFGIFSRFIRAATLHAIQTDGRQAAEIALWVHFCPRIHCIVSGIHFVALH